MKKNKFYVTTPIYYATARPHLGSLYSTLLADVASKWNKLKNNKVFFLTGTDEHGNKIEQAAYKVSMTPKDFVDSFIADYKHIWKEYQIDYNYFIRTTDPEHIKAVQFWISQLIDKGDIYESKYQGWYCTPCETFLTEHDIQNDIQNNNANSSPLCPTCNRPTSFIEEESYFFKLSKYQNKLLEFYKNNPDFVVPKERLNEVIKFVESGLKDLSISRTTVKWGIPFPNNNKHIAYVWADALLNYILAIGYANPIKKEEFNYWWPVDLQVIGKDILRFHAIYWPAFLMAIDLPLPKKLLVHGWIKVNQQKMSKSFGNVINPQDLFDKYGSDPIRYYLISQFSINHDTEFSIHSLETHISTDLANDLGNLLNRTITLAIKNELYNIPIITKWSENSIELHKNFNNTIQEFIDNMDKYSYHLAIAALWKFIAKINAYFHANEPWKLAINNKIKFTEIISATCHSLDLIGNLLWPIMPEKSNILLDAIGTKINLDQNIIKNILESNWNKSFNLKKIDTLFKKIEEPKDMEESKKTELTQNNNNINIEDLIKIELTVGTIQECEEIPKSDKLFKLKVDFGSKGIRQILSGVKKHFNAQDLINKQAIFVFNLYPRQMLGYESQGMMLTAQDKDGKLQLITTTNPVPNGTELK